MKHWLSPRPTQTIISKFSSAVCKKGCPVFPLPTLSFIVFPGGDSEGVDITPRGLAPPPPPLFPLPPVYRVGGGGTDTPHPQTRHSRSRRMNSIPCGTGKCIYTEIELFDCIFISITHNCRNICNYQGMNATKLRFGSVGSSKSVFHLSKPNIDLDICVLLYFLFIRKLISTDLLFQCKNSFTGIRSTPAFPG